MRGVASVILGVLVIVGIALYQGVAIGSGDYTVPLITISAAAITILTLAQPEFGILFYLGLVYFEKFLPIQFQPNEYMSGIVFGLNFSNAILLLIFGSWIARLILARDRSNRWLPSGRFGKLILLYILMSTVGLGIILVTRYVTTTLPFREGVGFFLQQWRNMVMVPLIALIIMQSILSPRFVDRLGIFFVVAMVALAGWSVVTLAQEFAVSANYLEFAPILRNAPIDLQVASLAFVGVCIAMVILSKNALNRVLWLALLIVLLAAIAYLQRRATYIGVVIEFIVVLYIIGRRDRRYRAAANAMLVMGVVAAVIATPIVVIDRIAYTIQVVGGEYTLESSVAIRLRLWGFVFSGMLERWWSVLWGNGLAFASTGFTRSGGFGGFSVHNIWLNVLVDHGIIGVVLFAYIFIEIFRVNYSIGMASTDVLQVAFAISIAAMVMAVQPWLLTHSTGFVGQYGVLLFVWTAAFTARSRSNTTQSNESSVPPTGNL